MGFSFIFYLSSCLLIAPERGTFDKRQKHLPMQVFLGVAMGILQPKGCVRVSDSVFERIYAVVKTISAGRVATYGMVAMLAGNPRWARVVGYALHVNPQPGIIPCHRVVNRFGETAPGFAFGGGDVQRDLLEAEGVVFGADGRIDLSVYGLFAPPKQVDE